MTGAAEFLTPAVSRPRLHLETSAQDDGLSTFFSVRPRLLGIACRMLGNAAEAEDIVQEVWVRWQTTDRSVVRDPPAFLATATTRLAMNVVQSARSRRETYVGTFPEPVDTSGGPGSGSERGEALKLAVLIVLEKLSPAERAAYVLREAFDYPYQQIAKILHLTEANARQLVTRARIHIGERRRTPVNPAEQKRLLSAFAAASQKGDFAALESLLASDAVSCSDGGGFVRAEQTTIARRGRAAQFIAAIASLSRPVSRSPALRRIGCAHFARRCRAK